MEVVIGGSRLANDVWVPTCPVHRDSVVTRAGSIARAQARIPRFLCRPPGPISPHMFTALSGPEGPPPPTCVDHPSARVVFWGSYDSPSGPVRRARCLPGDDRAHTFLVRPADQLMLDLETVAGPCLVVPDAYSLSMVARALSRLAYGSSYRAVSAAARAEAGAPASASWSLAARWCESLGLGVARRLLPSRWPASSAVVPVGLPGTDALLLAVVDAERGVPLVARVVPASGVAAAAAQLPSWLSGQPQRVLGCPQSLAGFSSAVERVGSTVGWVEWSLASQEKEAARFVAELMQGEASMARMVAEVQAILGFVPGRGDAEVRPLLPGMWDLRTRLVGRGGTFRNVARTNALLGLFLLERHGQAHPETILGALVPMFQEASGGLLQAL